MKLLYLIISKKEFNKILSGVKKTKHIKINNSWTNKLFHPNNFPRKYNEILFSEGHNKNCRKMKVKFLGVKKEKNTYKISLGQTYLKKRSKWSWISALKQLYPKKIKPRKKCFLCKKRKREKHQNYCRQCGKKKDLNKNKWKKKWKI